MLPQLMMLGVMLLLSGFFSSAETALFSISKVKARHLAREGGRAGRLIKKMKDDSHNLLSVILIGNNVVNVGSSALATSLTLQLFESNAVGIATGVMTFLILVFGEIFPKSLATRNKVMVAKAVIFPIYWLSYVVKPVVVLLNFIPMILGKIDKSPTVTEEELMTMVEVVEEEGEIKAQEKRFIYNVFEFDDTCSSEIMTPRADMFVVDVNETLNLEEIINSGFSRIPVIDGEIDNVVGVLNIKDLFKSNLSGTEKLDPVKIMRKPHFIPESKKLDSLLHQFKKMKQHMVIVVDEHGGVAGLISLEDVIEELVGEIRDETDKEEPLIVKLKNGKWYVAGKAEIDEVNEALDMNIPDSETYDTFSGYVLDEIGRIPNEKEILKVGGFTVHVKEMEGNRIKSFVVRKSVKEPRKVSDQKNP